MNQLVAVTKIQAAFRGYAARKDLNQQNTAATTIQKNFRGHKTRKEMEEQDKSARVIQRNFRSYQERREDLPWWKRFCNKCTKFGKKITGAFHKDTHPRRSPSFPKDEDEYKPPLNNPYDENPAQQEEYNVPEGKNLTLLQLAKIYDKKQESNVEETKPLTLPPPRLVAGIDAVQSDVGAYQQPQPHRVIKYHAPTPPESPEKKAGDNVDGSKPIAAEEEGNFFTRLFKPSETKPEEPKPEEKKPETENVAEEMFGKFKGLFTRDEKPKEPDVEPLVASDENEDEVEEEIKREVEEVLEMAVEGSEEVEESDIEEEPQTPQEEKVDVLARFQNRFKREYNIAQPQAQAYSEDTTDSKVDDQPKQEPSPAPAEDGAFSKFTGIFKSDNKESQDASSKDESSFSSKFTGLFKKDESDTTTSKGDTQENNGDVKQDNQVEGGFFGKLFKKDEDKPAQPKPDNPSEESGIDKMFSIFKKN